MGVLLPSFADGWFGLRFAPISTSTRLERKLEFAMIVDMFRVKICGITTVEDALVAVEAGADAIGLNFYAQSVRFLSPSQARHIVAALPKGVLKVGLFVNAEPAHIRTVAEHLGLHAIQLHGDEPPQTLSELGGLPILKAFRIGAEGLKGVRDYLSQCDTPPDMILFDAQVPGQYGGTGALADWKLAAELGAEEHRVILAGGLTAANVAEAIRSVRPRAVDTASGVESSPGRKNPAAVRAFVAAAKQAFVESEKR